MFLSSIKNTLYCQTAMLTQQADTAGGTPNYYILSACCTHGYVYLPVKILSD